MLQNMAGIGRTLLLPKPLADRINIELHNMFLPITLVENSYVTEIHF